jgi:hypothetical protein
LRDGPRGFGPGSTWPALLRMPPPHLPPSPTGLSPSLVCHSGQFGWGTSAWWAVLQPPGDVSPGFGPFPVRSPLLRESLLLSLPPGTEMFQFPGFAPAAYGFSGGSLGHPGISARLTAPPGLSQSAAPVLASWRPDIPHTPCVAWPPRPRAPAPRPRGGMARRPRGPGRRHRPARVTPRRGRSNVSPSLLRLGPKHRTSLGGGGSRRRTLP